jgi:hypothetical protein
MQTIEEIRMVISISPSSSAGTWTEKYFRKMTESFGRSLETTSGASRRAVKLEDLQPNASVRGILPDALVAVVVNAQRFGSEAVELTYRDQGGRDDVRSGARGDAAAGRRTGVGVTNVPAIRSRARRRVPAAGMIAICGPIDDDCIDTAFAAYHSRDPQERTRLLDYIQDAHRLYKSDPVTKYQQGSSHGGVTGPDTPLGRRASATIGIASRAPRPSGGAGNRARRSRRGAIARSRADAAPQKEEANDDHQETTADTSTRNTLITGPAEGTRGS